jgi:centromeric protein E
MEGYHGTVFAYGMTGTGKTFSMQGTATSPGIIPLAITDIFSFIRETPQREFLLRVSYLEIYNEKIHDLLAGQPAPGVPQEEIKLREDSKRGVYATPLKEEIVQSPTQLLRVIARGDLARRVAGTQFNARSSRSHAVVQIVVESRERIAANVSSAESKRQALLPGGVRVSTLSLIDLAGSERAAEDKERRTEGAHINKSLLTLGTVIAKLSVDDKSKPASEKAKDSKHLPYRDSKLTRLLQPALAGNSLISILCTIQIGSAGSIASAQNHTLETLNTLKFASRAKNNIVSHAKKAEDAFGGAGDAGSRALLDRYRMEIQDLKKQLESQGKKEKTQDKEDDTPIETAEILKAKELEQEQRHEEQMLEMQLARTALKERIEHLNRLILSSKSIGVNNSRSISQMSNGRQSVMTNGENGNQSARSSTQTLSPPILNRNSSSGSMRSFRQSTASTVINEQGEEEEEDSMGENGDGNATAALQIRALQADLADKNRYISTLEKRLLQARRSSHSRVSMSFGQRAAMGEDGGWENLVREKDGEIAELRARLDDKERMVSALRSAARKRDVADLTVDTASSSPVDRRSNSSSASHSARQHGHGGMRNHSMSPRTSAASPRVSGGLQSPLGITMLSPEKNKTKSVDEMTKLLDEMITERVHNGTTVANLDRKNSKTGLNHKRGDSAQDRVDSAISVSRTGSGGLKTKMKTSVRISEPTAS